MDFVYTGHAHYYERLCAVEILDPLNFTNTTCAQSKTSKTDSDSDLNQGSGSMEGGGRDRPVYVVDGTAGAEPDMTSPDSELTMYKEFGKWGYSRFFVEEESLELKHYAAKIGVDGSSVVLPYEVTDSIKLLRQ